MRLERLHLNPGVYIVGLWLADPIEIHFRDVALDHVRSAFTVEVVDAEPRGLGMRLKVDGVVACRFEVLEEGLPDCPSRLALIDDQSTAGVGVDR